MNIHRPPAIRTDTSNAFAHHSMRVRVPRIISEIQTQNSDYSGPIMDSLNTLRENIENNRPISMLELPAPDYDQWAAEYAAYEKDTWLDTDWFFAETFLYRHVIQAVRWWETGRDPFASNKAQELESDGLWSLLGTMLAAKGALDERLLAHIHAAIWGNRIDLSYMVSAEKGAVATHDDLLVDDSEIVVRHLHDTSGTIHVIADNAGTELAMDLLLIDTLLEAHADPIVLHLKLHPTFVSDATVSDVLSFVDRLLSSEQRAFGQRLQAALTGGRLRLAPDSYWNSSKFLWDMPPRLWRTFQDARLVIVKGDANYRRMVGDAIWPTEMPFSTVMAYFNAPLLALRTLKSDPIVGLPPGLATSLEGIDPEWRVNAQRGLIQSNLMPDKTS